MPPPPNDRNHLAEIAIRSTIRNMGSDRETEREGWGGGYISYPSNSLLSPSRKRLPRMLRDTDINIIIIIVIIIPAVPAPAAIDLF